MAEGKGLFESLVDFSFREHVTTRNVKFLYGLHLLLGLIAAVAGVVMQFQAGGATQGLLALLLAVIGYFLWMLYVRITLEFLLAVFRVAESAARAAGLPER